MLPIGTATRNMKQKAVLVRMTTRALKGRLYSVIQDWTNVCLFSNLPGYDLICNCDSKEPGAIDVGVLTSKDQLPVRALNYGDDNYIYQWKKYELGNLVCQGKGALFPSEEKNEEKYQQLKTEIGEVKDDLGETQTDLDDLESSIRNVEVNLQSWPVSHRACDS